MKDNTPIDTSQRVLVTGASGFLGTHLIRRLSSEGWCVRGSYYHEDDVSHLAGLPWEAFPGDICRAKDVERSMQGVRVVIHAAGNCSFLPWERQLQHRVNVVGTQRVVAAAMACSVERFVHISSVNAFGYPTEGAVGTETTPYNWGPFDIGYMETKRAAQQVVLGAVREGLNGVVCNPGTMFGPEDVRMNAASYVYHLNRARVVMLCPPGGSNIVDVRGVVSGIMAAWRFGQAGRTYVLGGTNVTYQELFTYILRRLGRQVKVVVVPHPLWLALGQMLLRVERWGMRLPLTGDMVFGSAKKLFYDSRRAATELGYEPPDPFLAIDETIKWLGYGLAASGGHCGAGTKCSSRSPK